MSLKSFLTCFNCSKIYNNPILLPCADCICEHHLKEENTLKPNQIKCSKCNKTFDLEDNTFKQINLLKEMLDNELYLTDEEKCLKHQIEFSLNEYFQIQDELIQSKKDLQSELNSHFREMMHRIDLNREEMPKIYEISIMKRLDDVALEMLEQVNLFEDFYLKFINFKLEFPLKALEEEINILNDTFRDPNISLNKIKQIKIEQELSLANLKLKLGEINQIKEHFQTNWTILTNTNNMLMETMRKNRFWLQHMNLE